MADTPSIPTLFDYNQTDTAPITNRPAQALYSKQGGAVLLGSDYGSTPKAQALKIDANGNLSTIPSTATTGAISPGSATTALGNVHLAMLSGAPTAAQMDGLGNIAAQPVQNATFSVVVSAVTTANAKSMLAVLNKSTSSILRLVACFAQNSARTPSTLTTYYVYAQELRFITGFSGGTAATPTSWDSADTLAANITCATGATVSGEGAAPIRRWVTSNYPLAPGATAAEDTTGDAQGREPWHQRYDPSAKCITIRPGSGLHLKCASTSDNGAQDVTFVFTQAQA